MSYASDRGGALRARFMREFDDLPREARDWINYYDKDEDSYAHGAHLILKAFRLGGKNSVLAILKELEHEKKTS